ncbi:MAG: Wzz/FepE/Etk N-terminal domain-containing protein [Rikenellaceae bacterium]
MNYKEFDFTETLKEIWHRRKAATLYVIAGGILGFLTALSTPKEYTSETLLTPENKSKSTNSSLGGLASMMDIDMSNSPDGITSPLYPDIIYSSPLLLEFANLKVEYNKEEIPLHSYLLEHKEMAWWSYALAAPSLLIELFSNEKPHSEPFHSSPYLQKMYCSELRGSITTSVDKSLGTISIKVSLQDPKIAKTLLDSLVRGLEKYVNDYRSTKTLKTLASTTKMLEDAKAKFYTADSNYANAIDKNQNIISKSAAIHLERLKNEREIAYQIFAQLSLQAANDKVKLQESRQIITAIEPPTTPLKPSKPNTKLLIIAFAILSLGFFSIRVALKVIRT